jgi:hypothetical protein
MDYEQNLIIFIKSMESYLDCLNNVTDTSSKEKILHSMFKYVYERKHTIDFDNLFNLKNAIHEKLCELYHNYDLSWANQLHYDIFNSYIYNYNINSPKDILFEDSNFDTFKNYIHSDSDFSDFSDFKKCTASNFDNNIFHEYTLPIFNDSELNILEKLL